MPLSPLTRRILDATMPPAAQWVVDLMRRLEENDLDPAARWERLRRRLEGIASRRAKQLAGVVYDDVREAREQAPR